MKEYQREYAVREIVKKINTKKSLKIKKTQLEELKKNQFVIQYLKLLDEIENLEKTYSNYNSEEKIIEYVFANLISDDFKCHHEIWLYAGSCYESIDPRCEHDHLLTYLDENLPVRKGEFEFEYNRYICLECGEKVETKCWEVFEENHFVLKNQNEDTKVEYYRSLYYQTLYNKTVEEARETVIRAFNIEKAKSKTLKK